MPARWISLLVLFGFCSFASLLVPAQAPPDPWSAWLDEVDLIMTKTERAVFKSLQTDEQRRTFQSFFWRVRDATPGTPENEFRTEFYSRRKYAESRLEGVRSDRGRIYVILGKPAEVQNFSGLDKVVDCELWIYRGEGRSGLPPLMYLLFFRPDAVGEYKLFYPGADSALEILSPGAQRGRTSPRGAFQAIQASYPELAKATQSVIPDEADGTFGPSLNSSGQTIGMIFTLPEREVDRTYLMTFGSPAGSVDVSYTTKEIAGKATAFVTEDQGARFLSYALMPDRITTARTQDGFETAHLVFQLRVSDKAERTVFQQEKEIRLRLDEPKVEAMRRQKLSFSDFAPLIDGEFRVRLTFTNKTSEEFFVAEQDLVVNSATPALAFGYQVKEKPPDAFLPFGLGPLKVLLDPRSIFSRRDSLEGRLFAGDTPELVLEDREGARAPIAIPDVSRRGEAYNFRKPLADVVPGNYDLVVRIKGAEVYRRGLFVLSFEFEKPLVFERTEPATYGSQLPFVLGQEYLNAGRPAEAIECFARLPPDLWNGATLPVIARAYYLQKDYSRVVELLEGDKVDKSFPVLVLLGNASLELKRLDRAAVYFEEARKFGDTAEVNNALGAVYFSLGDRKKAQVYWDRAKALEQKAPDKTRGPVEKKSGS